MFNLLNSLKEKLELEYIAIIGKDGFSVYEVKGNLENPEEKIAVFSEILINEISFAETTMNSSLEASELTLGNGRKLFVLRLNQDYFILTVFSQNTPSGKVRFFLHEYKEKILEKL